MASQTPFSEHRIATITHHPLLRRYPRPIGWNAQGGPHGETQTVIACRITTDQGATGFGFGVPQDGRAQIFVGRRLDELFAIATGTAPEARMIDVPLHDLAGNILGQPVWRMLGAHGSAQMSVYSGAIYFDDLHPGGIDPGMDAILASCRQDAAAGHAHFKLKIGRGHKYMPREEGDARDIAVTRLVREHFPQAKILVDGNDGYDPDGICRYLEAVADCGLYWIEEPFLDSESGFRQLRAAIDRLSPTTLIADGESRNGRLQDPLGPLGKWQREHVDELVALVGKGLIDVLLMDVGAMGFSAWRDVMPVIQSHGGQGSPHAWSEPFKSLYAAQIGAGLGGVPIVEGVPGYVEGVDASAYTFADGILTLPETPGFGLKLLDD